MFDNLTVRDARPIALMKQATLVVFAVCLAAGLASAHRAYVQVRRLGLDGERILRGGSVIRATVVSSGRTFVDVEVALVQGARSERLAALDVGKSEYAAFDPRARRASREVTLTPELLARFRPGAARVRAVARGRSQWARVPPPVVTEMEVEVQHR